MSTIWASFRNIWVSFDYNVWSHWWRLNNSNVIKSLTNNQKYYRFWYLRKPTAQVGSIRQLGPSWRSLSFESTFQTSVSQPWEVAAASVTNWLKSHFGVFSWCGFFRKEKIPDYHEGHQRLISDWRLGRMVAQPKWSTQLWSKRLHSICPKQLHSISSERFYWICSKQLNSISSKRLYSICSKRLYSIYLNS